MTTIVAVGVSVNIAIPSLLVDGVNAAYQVVLPRDSLAGVPREHATQVIDNSLSLLATVTNTQELVDIWSLSPHAGQPMAPEREKKKLSAFPYR